MALEEIPKNNITFEYIHANPYNTHSVENKCSQFTYPLT